MSTKELIRLWHRYNKYRNKKHVRALQEYSSQEDARRSGQASLNVSLTNSGLIGAAIGNLYTPNRAPKIEEPTFENFMKWLEATEE